MVLVHGIPTSPLLRRHVVRGKHFVPEDHPDRVVAVIAQIVDAAAQLEDGRSESNSRPSASDLGDGR